MLAGFILKKSCPLPHQHNDMDKIFWKTELCYVCD